MAGPRPSFLRTCGKRTTSGLMCVGKPLDPMRICLSSLHSRHPPWLTHRSPDRHPPPPPQVFVDGTTKKLSLREQNLLPHDAPTEPEGMPPELVRVGGKIAVVRERCGDMLVRVEGVHGDEAPRWVAMLPDGQAANTSGVAVRMEEAAEETMPTGLLPGSRVSAKDAHRRGGPRQARGASIAEARSEPDGRLWLFVEWEPTKGGKKGANQAASQGLWCAMPRIEPISRVW